MSPRAFFLPVLLGTSLLLAACQSTAPAAPSGPPVSPATEAPPQAPEPTVLPEPAPEPPPTVTTAEPTPPPAPLVCPPPVTKPAPAERPRPASPIPVLGELERVVVDPPQLMLEARLDTGAAGSVIDARNAREFERDGKTWVKFTLLDPATTKAIEVSRPVVRSFPIKDSSARRYVVTLHIRLGEIDQYTELSLADRSGQRHPLILGRNFLRDQALVDVSRRFTVPASKP